MLFKKIDRLKVLYKEQFNEEVCIPKHNEGALYLDEKKKMRLSVESRNFVDAFLRNVPSEIKGIESVDIVNDNDSYDARYRVKFIVSFWNRQEHANILNKLINNAKVYSMILVNDYDDDYNRFYVNVNLEMCFPRDDKVKYDELSKKYNNVLHELDLLKRDFENQIRDWEIECINSGEIVPFYFDNEL
jgi:hypothetical protein